MYIFSTPVFEIAPYATFCILLLMVVCTIYLRNRILAYAQKNLHDCFSEFKLYEELQDDTTSLALYCYITSNAFQQTNDPVFIALCKRYIRWGQMFIITFVVAVADVGFLLSAD
ncbi:hypothetical protein [Cellvibrio fibrivorans]|uniref:Uncharacterized protein n=1 Tax=Cellvibrio fibrivorans TaxID=126350 RepID=A0ABU1UYV1_9GAMM|nr:hypothetical protein [Cellvibrio fibrivorans]MDR7090374.1 hypothetical protein [Cellvibrio fibrivorans]